MSKGILIFGAAGTGKSTLGRSVAQELGFSFVDIDDYIWRKDTDVPFSLMYTREEKISGLMNAIADTGHFVMAGSMTSFHEYFDPLFELAVFLTADTQLRIQRIQQREYELFGDRIKPGGDMYQLHCQFLERTAGYDSGVGSPNLMIHTQWAQSLRCKVLRLDGSVPVLDNARLIVEKYNRLYSN